MSTPFDIILMANSPGELSAFAIPVANQFKKKSPESRLILILTPCQYASGMEVDFAISKNLFDIILSSEEYKRLALTGKLPADISFAKNGIILYLGGDLLHPIILSKRFGFKAYAYLAGEHVGMTGQFEKFFVPYKKKFENKIPTAKLIEVGDMMTEPPLHVGKEEAINALHLKKESKKIAMMPGSREWAIKYLLPFYSDTSRKLKEKDSSIETILVLSPFIRKEKIEEIRKEKIFDAITTFDYIKSADLVLTIPGTNTAHLAATGMPMIVIFPLDQIDLIPLEGLSHYITAIPIIGKIIKRFIAFIVNKKTKYFALPNIKANREIVKEIRGTINRESLVNEILIFINNKNALEKSSSELLSVMTPANTAEKIVDEILRE